MKLELDSQWRHGHKRYTAAKVTVKEVMPLPSEVLVLDFDLTIVTATYNLSHYLLIAFADPPADTLIHGSGQGCPWSFSVIAFVYLRVNNGGDKGYH